MLFIAILQNHPSEISSEFQMYIAETKVIDKKDKDDEELALSNVRPPSHSLELNLMIVFLYMASR
jgi:hypothetical protein